MGPPQTFPLRRSRWSWIFLRPLAWGPLEAEIDQSAVRVRMGWIGSAQIPLELIDRVGRMDWPWWGGIGARLGKGLVAFVASSGSTVTIELSAPLKVRAPLGWTTSKVLIAVEDVDGFIQAVADARRPRPQAQPTG
jgi:hypothetical protein